MMPSTNKTHRKATLAVGGGFFLMMLPWMATPAQGQLRLDDVFSTQSMTLSIMTLQDFEADPDKVHVVLDQLREMKEQRNFRDLLPASEPLAAWLDRESPEFGDILHLRAVAYKGLNQTTPLKTIAAEYLRTFGEDDVHSGWFLLELARESSREGNQRTAMGFWLRLIGTDFEIPVEEGLTGARLFLDSAQPRDTRRVLNRTFRGETTETASAEQLQQREMLLIESLLLRDDDSIELPSQRPPTDRESLRFNLRRAMVMEIREGLEEVLPVYQSIQEHATLLPSAERELLRQRIAQAGRQPWPPPR